MDLVEALRKAKGSEVLPTVLMGMKNAEVVMLEAADRIESLERTLKIAMEETCNLTHEVNRLNYERFNAKCGEL